MKPVIRLPHVVENESLRKRGRALSASHGHLQWMYQERCAEVESLTAALGVAKSEAEKIAPWRAAVDAEVADIHGMLDEKRNEIKGLKKELDASTDALLKERTAKDVIREDCNAARAEIERLNNEVAAVYRAKNENDERKHENCSECHEEALEAAVKAEREACAQLAEDEARNARSRNARSTDGNEHDAEVEEVVCGVIADAIRDRSKTVSP